MYPVAHIGIGSLIVLKTYYRKYQNVKLSHIFLGTLLPDLIDKPIYYIGKYFQVAEYSLLSVAGSRNYSHTLLFAVIIFGLSLTSRKALLLSVSLGVISHQLIDIISDMLISWNYRSISLGLIFWPAYGTRFPKGPFANFSEHLKFWFSPYEISGELLGLTCLIYILSKSNRRRLECGPY
jgi:hypothetical protein